MTTGLAGKLIDCDVASDRSQRAVFSHGQAMLLVDSSSAVLAFPADTATTAQLHFAIRYSSGLIHAAMPSARLDKLRIPNQPTLSAEDSGTDFTVAVDAASGISTGISAHDRARTMRVLADPYAAHTDLTRPGHVLPIRCHDDGFTARARVWELAVDLVAATGHIPVAVACRLVSDTGGLLTGSEAVPFARNHRLPLIENPPWHSRISGFTQNKVDILFRTQIYQSLEDIV